MTHRGPDGAGCIMFDSRQQQRTKLFEHFDSAHPPFPIPHSPFDVGLGHRRLSIIDLNTGGQPMANEDGSIWIVFNGEIYNYKELKTELLSAGHIFRTASDTEVIIHAYEQYGEDCPTRFNGIFGFALWDASKRSLFLARDHYGVKPVYYYRTRHRFYFASELKAILVNPEIKKGINLDALNLCLTFRHTPSPWTLLKDIYKLPAGCSLTVTNEGTKETKFWSSRPTLDYARSEKDWLGDLEAKLDGAIARQMVSDVPIAVSLSSGVDSTTVLALMSEHSSVPVNAFTVGFEGREPTSEIGPAEQMAARFKSNFYQQVITANDYDSFMSRYLWHLEEPIGNESAAAYYFVAEMAHKNGIKVLLNGQGADEAFAGYGRYIGAAYDRWLQFGALPPLRWMLPHIFGGTLLGERYQRFLYTRNTKDETEKFLHAYSIMNNDMKGGLINRGIVSQINEDLPRQYMSEQLMSAPNGTMLERMTYIDTRTSLPDNLLLCEDKMAMAASVEARVPFLDLEFMDVAERIPGKLKLRGLRDKYIHRKACAKWIGNDVASRPQIGFDNAVDLWLRAQLGQRLYESIDSDDSFTHTYLNPPYVRHLMEEHAEKKRNHQRILFLVLSLESWYYVFIKNTSSFLEHS